MKIYLDGELIFKDNNTINFKVGHKMWVFETNESIYPKETEYVDFRLIPSDVNGVCLELYFIDKDLNFWKKEKCFFNFKTAETEKQKRLNKKYEID